MQTGLNIYFSDFFGVDEDIIESYGAVNISLINDMPLFVKNKNIKEYIITSSSIYFFYRKKPKNIPLRPWECLPRGISFLK